MIDKGWSCAEAVVLVLGPELGVQHDDDPVEATPFCGGIGRLGYICGAVSGGLLIVGRMTGKRYGRYGKPNSLGAKCRAMTRELVRSFEEQAGSLLC